MQNPWGSSTPPGGYQFHQAQTGFDMPNPVSQTIASATKELLRHRMKNPVTSTRHGLSTRPAAVEQEIITFNALRLGIDTTPPAPQAQTAVGQASSCCGG